MKNYKFWFVVGSQSLYGEDTLEKVEINAKDIVNNLNDSDFIDEEIIFKSVATTSEEITEIMKEANYKDEVAGVITWMHTFSPAKMWINGTKILQKPLLHFATQYYESIPWENIDMDYMNLHQSAHGDREYGYINARLNKNNKVIFGYWKNEEIQKELSDWMKVAIAYNESQNIKVCRFGDNMRDVAVTEGDKIEAQIKFGWVVDYYAVGDLVKEIEKVTDKETDDLYEEYKQKYNFVYTDENKEYFEESVKYQAKLEIAIERFLLAGGYSAFTTNFEDLYGMKQLPGLAVQRLNEKGYGFAGEGDWKTAALNRMLKIMSGNYATGFTEDYTYELKEGKEAVLEAHMLEVDPTMSKNKPSIVVKPLSIGGKEDPARLIFESKNGKGVVTTISDFGDRFKMLVNEVDIISVNEKAPNLPVARIYWETKPNLKTVVKKWIKEGGGHHSVVSMGINKDQIIDLAKMFDIQLAIID
ncbi:MAG: L-arabinose isomerase [Anaerococcus hydrogenalis]|uniref:L-arabinose isomerase n=1 Tax=Anaerococcus hydrogenalis TaxID=33029 RepID=UPI002904AFE4|nr:L-arabinose isomerase [Anaerococcus hydrogenalis]MDU2582885.1 L-arabinose isomerase [Anaerococcus hydrogenalis]